MKDAATGETGAAETKNARLKLREDGVLEIRMKEGDLDLEGAKALMAGVRDVSGGTLRPAVALLGKVGSVTREARHYFARQHEVSAVAMVVGSPLSRAVGNFFLGINKPPVPIRLFETADEAGEWLRRVCDF